MSFAGEAGGEINLTGGALRVNEWLSSALVRVCQCGMDTGFIGGGDDVKLLVEFMMEDCWESKVEPSVKPAVFGEV
jgi:hypothetical protein